MTVQTIISMILAFAGMIFMLISLLGLAKYPDFFTRLHVQGVGDTLGALLIILAMMVQTGFSLFTLKLFLAFLLIMLTNPLGTNMMMIAATNRSKEKKNYKVFKKAKKEEEGK